MNTNQFNLFQSWKRLYTFIAVLFKLFDRVMWRIKLPSSRRRWGKQPAKMNNFLGLAPSSPASSIPAAYVLPFVSNFHQDWNLNSPFWSASNSGWIMGVASGCPWSVWLNQVTCLRLVLVAPLPERCLGNMLHSAKGQQIKTGLKDLTVLLSNTYNQDLPWDFEINLFLDTDEYQHCWSTVEEELAYMKFAVANLGFSGSLISWSYICNWNETQSNQNSDYSELKWSPSMWKLNYIM